jgi:hypothetical protein
MSSALANRFVHLVFEPDLDDNADIRIMPHC